jgi:hypothetical protein
MFDPKRVTLKLEKVPFEDASENYTLDGITDDELSDLFPDDPEHFHVHVGNVTVDGPMVVGYDSDKDDLTVYVIEGDLTVHGPLVFQQADAYAALFVTGNVTCDDAYIAWDAQLFVGGSMTVKGLLATYITDAGHFSIKNSLAAGSWLEAGDRGCIEIGKKPAARLLRVGEHRYYVFGPYAKDGAEDAEADPDQKFGFTPKEAVSIVGILHPSLFDGDEDVDTDKLGEAIKQGKPLFADIAPTSTKPAKKPPAATKPAATKPAARKQAKSATTKPAKKPVKKSATKPVKKSATKPVKKSATKPVKKSAKKSQVKKPKRR